MPPLPSERRHPTLSHLSCHAGLVHLQPLIFDNTRNIRLRDAIEEADFVGPKLADGALELFPVRGPWLPVRVEVTSPSSPSSTITFVHTMDSRTTIGVRVSSQVRWKEAMIDDGLHVILSTLISLGHTTNLQ